MPIRLRSSLGSLEDALAVTLINLKRATINIYAVKLFFKSPKQVLHTINQENINQSMP